MADKKGIPFALLRILETYTDEDHPLSASAIMDHLENDYGFEIERRTLYSNIETLIDNGYDIADWNETGKGYYLRTRQFDNSEVLILCNAIHASHFISSSQSKVLIDKLLHTLSKEQRKEFFENAYIDNNQKTKNQELMKNIRKISNAIHEHNVIQFQYLQYGFDRKQHPKDSGKIYMAEPRYLVYRNERPYMIATQSDHPGFIHYRIDRMQKVNVMNISARPLSRKENTDAYVYARNKLFMFSGEEVSAVLHCENRILDTMIDLFGTDARIIEESNGYFDMYIKGTRRGLIFFAQQYLDAVSILSPADLRDEMKDTLKDALRKYH